MITLTKTISSGTTALVHSGEILSATLRRQLLDPIRGIGADLLVTITDTIRAYTYLDEITPPAAAIRMAAAFQNRNATPGQQIAITTESGNTVVTYDAGEYAIDHGPWAITGGTTATATGHDRTMRMAGITNLRPALGVSVGERTVAVVALESAEELTALDFSIPPTVSESADLIVALTILGERQVNLTDSDGQILGTQAIGALQARGYDVHSGEIYSADALAIAAAGAARTWLGDTSAHEWIVAFSAGNTRVNLGSGAIASAAAEVFAEIEFFPTV